MNKKIIIPLIILIIAIAGAAVYTLQILDKVNEVKIPEKDEDLGIKEEVIEREKTETNKREIINIALFGIDKRETQEKGRSDSIMIGTLDTVHKKIKLTSIMRDTYVDIPGRGMDKINHAYAFGGPELSLRTINQNFDMNIREFAAVDFDGLEHIIDSLGGLEINIKDYEVRHVPGTFVGRQILNGKQALAYSRIRKSGDGDFERTERHRVVLEKIINKGLRAGIMQYPKLLTNLLPYVDTSLSKNEMLKLGTSSFKLDIKNIEKFRIPVDNHGYGQFIDRVWYLIPDTLEENTEFLHEFIYEEKKDPSPRLQ